MTHPAAILIIQDCCYHNCNSEHDTLHLEYFVMKRMDGWLETGMMIPQHVVSVNKCKNIYNNCCMWLKHNSKFDIWEVLRFADTFQCLLKYDDSCKHLTKRPVCVSGCISSVNAKIFIGAKLPRIKMVAKVECIKPSRGFEWVLRFLKWIKL